MKKLNIDYKNHMGYSRSAERGMKAWLSQKYSPVECEHLVEKIIQKYEEFLVDLPYCGGKHNLIVHPFQQFCLSILSLQPVFPQGTL